MVERGGTTLQIYFSIAIMLLIWSLVGINDGTATCSVTYFGDYNSVFFTSVGLECPNSVRYLDYNLYGDSPCDFDIYIHNTWNDEWIKSANLGPEEHLVEVPLYCGYPHDIYIVTFSGSGIWWICSSQIDWPSAFREIDPNDIDSELAERLGLSGTIQEEINNPPYEPQVVFPPNSAIDTSTNPTLQWRGGDLDDDTVTYTVYLDTSSNPSEQIYQGTFNYYSIPELKYDTRYYWRVCANDDNDETCSDIYSFETHREPNNPPNKPEIVTPNQNVQVDSNRITLRWDCEDPDGDDLEFTVYISDNINTPGNPIYNGSQKYYSPALEYGKTYQWRVDACDGKTIRKGDTWGFTTPERSILETPTFKNNILTAIIGGLITLAIGYFKFKSS